MNWPALLAAGAHDAATRLPFVVGGRAVGSVARAHIDALRAWPDTLAVTPHAVELIAADRDAALARVNAALRSQGLLRGWRDELVAVTNPASKGPVLARTERAAARFWGTLTLGAHANGHVAGADGRPAQLWIAQRSATKATDPGLYDNLIGGGVAAGQTPLQTLVREGFEEAGLTPQQLSAVQRGGVMRLQRDVAEGLQVEDLHSFDIALPAGTTPCNQDGEVQRFVCLPVADALALAAGPTMTVDAALVTLDFALRHRLLPPADAAALAARLAPLFSAAVRGGQST